MRPKGEIDGLVEDHLGLVREVAGKYFPRLCHDQDLLQCGAVGLWNAAEKWREECPFPAYARKWVYGAMLRYVKGLRKETDKLQAQDGAQEVEELMISRLDLARRICSAWPDGSKPRYILMAMMAGFERADIARELGMTPDAVAKAARRAWGKLGNSNSPVG